MLVFAGIGGLNHILVNGIHTAGKRLGQTAAGNDGIKLDGNTGFLKFVENHFAAEVELVGDFGKRGQFLGSMTDNFDQAGLAVFDNGHLGRG